MKRILLALLATLITTSALGQVPFYVNQPGLSGGGSFTAPVFAPDGACPGTPAYSFGSLSTTGLYAASGVGLCVANVAIGAFQSSGLNFVSGKGIALSQGGVPSVLTDDGATATIAQKAATTANNYRLYFSTTGPVYWQSTARTAGVLFSTVGGAAQMSVTQPAVPTVTTNGGTAPVCVGSDTAMACTIGTAPPAAATFTVTFSGTWPSAPSCIAIRGTTGATPLVQGVVSGTTTLVVNLSANLVASERYNIQCTGVS